MQWPVHDHTVTVAAWRIGRERQPVAAFRVAVDQAHNHARIVIVFRHNDWHVDAEMLALHVAKERPAIESRCAVSTDALCARLPRRADVLNRPMTHDTRPGKRSLL